MNKFHPDFSLAALASLALFLGLTASTAAIAQTATPETAETAVPAVSASETPETSAAPAAAPEYPPQPPVIQGQAKAGTIEILPAKSISMEEFQIDPEYQTHPPVRLTPDRSELIRLEQEAATVIVGNPLHLNVMADNAKTLVMVGRAPGATHFLALNAKGEVLMQRHVIVASPKEKYVRIRSSCAGGSANCQTTRVYYCPDMCHEVLIDAQSGASSPGAVTSRSEGGAPAGGAAAAMDSVGGAISATSSGDATP